MLPASLKHYQEFKNILADYQISDRACQALSSLKLVLMVGPSSTGKNTLIRKLLDTGDYYFIVSDTTRQPQVRDGQMERDGVQYFFRNEEEVLNDLKNGEFLEAAIIHEQQVSGISIRELEKAKTQAKIAITDIEIVGTDKVMRVKPDAIAIFLVPPSFEEWQKRMMVKGQMSQSELNNRLESAQKEFDAALSHDYYHFVITNDVNRSVELVNSTVNGKSDLQEQQKGRAIIKQLQQKLAQTSR